MSRLPEETASETGNSEPIESVKIKSVKKQPTSTAKTKPTSPKPKPPQKAQSQTQTKSKRKRHVESESESDAASTSKRQRMTLTDIEIETLSAKEMDELFEYVDDWNQALPRKIHWLNEEKDDMLYWTR